MQNCCIENITVMHHRYVIASIKGKFDQLDFKLQCQMYSLLSKSKNDVLYYEKYNVLGEIHRDNFNAFILEAQVRFLS